MTLATGKHIKPEQVEFSIPRGHPVPRETGGSVSEPHDKFPGLILVMCGFYGFLGAYLYATTWWEWVILPALSGALVVGGAVMMKRDHDAHNGRLR